MIGVFRTALIAACAANLDLASSEPDPRLADLAGHLTFVEQIEEDMARSKIRLEHIADRRLRRLVTTDIAWLKARRAAELRHLAGRLRAHDDLPLETPRNAISDETSGLIKHVVAGTGQVDNGPSPFLPLCQCRSNPSKFTPLR